MAVQCYPSGTGAPHHKCHWHSSAQTAFQGSPGSPGCHRNPCSAESILKGGAGPRAEFITLYSTREKKEKKAHPFVLCLRFLCPGDMVPLRFVLCLRLCPPPQAWHSLGRTTSPQQLSPPGLLALHLLKCHQGSTKRLLRIILKSRYEKMWD